MSLSEPKKPVRQRLLRNVYGDETHAIETRR